jgi:catechol 2,3-dioxygenase-like lactoylglutathione lyase family enzyme
MLDVKGMDHIVLNVADVERSVAFYRDVLGLGIERMDEWRGGKVGFPSVRLSADTLIDLVPVAESPERSGRVENLNHFCLVVVDEALEPIVEHLGRHGVPTHTGPARRWGAHGDGASIYFRDPDGNEIEARTYAPAALARLAQGPTLVSSATGQRSRPPAR